ncbi:MAG: enoyl-CoA hydratase/isomerase family protein [Dehalococcoidia bacterium]|nr:enoyl-CoA hydratase/isomerase family protein [Dehalococcoidia bacterium]
MTVFKTLLYEVEDGLAYVTLNRPQVLNIYNIQMRDDLHQVLGAIKEDPEVKAVILKGTGEKAFCAGADLSEFLTAPSRIIARQARWERDVWGLFLSLPQPMIAALHGFVLGSGIEMALCCDIRLASEDVRFGLPEAGLGIIPAAGGTQTLPRLIGRAKSLEMVLGGVWMDAREAHRVGFVNQVVPRAQLLPAAVGLAREIMAHDAQAVRTIKEAVNRGLDLSLGEGLELEARLAARVERLGR